MDGDVLDFGPHAGQGGGDRIVPLLPPLDDLDPQQGRIAAEFQLELLAVFGGDNQQRLLHVGTVREPFGGMQPDGPVLQREEGLLVEFVPKAAALAGGG